MKNTIPLTQDGLKAVLDYDSITGIFTWKKTDTRYHWKEGSIAGGKKAVPGKPTYILIRVMGTRYAAHRLAVLYMTGQWPSGIVDHINRNGTDNRWSNLRVVCPQVNALNSKSAGYTWNKKAKKYQARIGLNGRNISLGYYDCQLDARAAYLRARNSALTDLPKEKKSAILNHIAE